VPKNAKKNLLCFVIIFNVQGNGSKGKVLGENDM
jgi:hypothetical protein